jgi:hypothetical protein
MLKIIYKLIPLKVQSILFNSPLYLFLSYLDIQFKYKKQRYYSQFGEDSAISPYVGKENGFYLDIGSGHPVKGSNTYFLYKMGWRGVLVDPIERNIKLSKLIRKRDKSILGLVATENIVTEFFELRPYEYSTTNQIEASRLIENKQAKLVRKTKLKPILMSNIEIEFDAKAPSFLSIDCEGADLEILKNIDLDKLSFQVICIEDWESNKNKLKSKIEIYLEGFDYIKVKECGPSSIFLKGKFK